MKNSGARCCWRCALRHWAPSPQQAGSHRRLAIRASTDPTVTRISRLPLPAARSADAHNYFPNGVDSKSTARGIFVLLACEAVGRSYLRWLRQFRSAGVINAFCSGQTQELLSVKSSDFVSGETIATVNALVIMNRWRSPFDKIDNQTWLSNFSRRQPIALCAMMLRDETTQPMAGDGNSMAVNTPYPPPRPRRRQICWP